MEKYIKVGNTEIKMKATAGTPRRYRITFRRDLMADMYKLAQAFEGKKKSDTDFSRLDLEIFENVAYIMCKQADGTIPNTIDEWLDGLEFFDIYEVLPQILEMWNIETETQIESKKKLAGVVGK